MPRMTLCLSAKRKTTISLLQSAHTKGGTQLQSLGMCIPAPIAHVVLLANPAVQTTAFVPIQHPKEKNPWQGVCRRESHWM